MEPNRGAPDIVPDITVLVFLALRRRFFDDAGMPRPFALRPKRNTQDDPLDEFLAAVVLADLEDVRCLAAPGPLTTPDMVLCTLRRPTRPEDSTQLVGIEVKKLERSPRGTVARGSGLDYNTTPPCGRIRVYDVRGNAVDIRGFYLFVCLEPTSDSSGRVVVSAFALVDGNLLNEDFDLYLGITGERTKRIGLGTFADGADRARPMLIFGNPLGIPQLDRSATLVHPSDDLSVYEPSIQRAYTIKRTVSRGEIRSFHGYRHALDSDGAVVDLLDPFPTPKRDANLEPDPEGVSRCRLTSPPSLRRGQPSRRQADPPHLNRHRSATPSTSG